MEVDQVIGGEEASALVLETSAAKISELVAS